MKKLASFIISKLTAYPKNYENPPEAIILNLGNGMSGVIFEDEIGYGMLEVEGQAIYFSDLDDLVDFIVSTWR